MKQMFVHILRSPENVI